MDAHGFGLDGRRQMFLYRVPFSTCCGFVLFFVLVIVLLDKDR